MITDIPVLPAGIHHYLSSNDICLLTELPERMDEKGNIDPSTLDDLMPWAESLPEECYKRR